MTCNLCLKPIEDKAHVAVLIEGVVYQETPVSHAVDALDEVWLRHIECQVRWEDRGLWKRILDAIRSI